MSGTLTGKIALITGASRGIGREIACRLAAEGAFIAVHYAGGAEAAAETLRRVKEAGGDGFTIAADLGAKDGPERLAQGFLDALAERGMERRFDILINNAGIDARGSMYEIEPDKVDQILALNYRAPFFLIRRLAPALRDGGRIVNMSSMATRMAFPVMAAYAPAKAALESLTLILAKDLGPRGIAVNAVAPGAVDTDMNPIPPGSPRAEAVTAQVAMGRVGQVQDIGGVVLFLVGPDGGWVTGQRIEVSGGQMI